MTTTTKKSVFLLHGEELYLSMEKLNFWQKAFIKKYGEESFIEKIDGKNPDLAEFDSNLQSLPFLSEKKLVIVKDFISQNKDDEIKKMAKIIAKTPDFTVLIFHESKSINKSNAVHKKIADIGEVETFERLSPHTLSKKLQQEAQKKELKISAPLLNYLVTHCGSDLYTLINELEKLKTYAQESAITQQTIDELVPASLQTSIFKLTDKIGEKNVREALKTLKIIEENDEDLAQTFFMIVRHFRILIQVKDLIEKKETGLSIAKKIKQPPFVVQKHSGQSRNFTIPTLEKIYQNLLKIDHNFKTGVIKIFKTDNRQYKLAIEKLIIDCCK